MTECLKDFIEELGHKADNPALYDELISKELLKDVLEALEDYKKNQDILISYVSAAESAISRLFYMLDKVSFGLGYSRALTTLVDMCLRRENDVDRQDRQYRCFKTHEDLLNAIALHPHYSHTELANARGISKGRLSQIMVQLKENHLVLIDKLGKENRYELTIAAKEWMSKEKASFSNAINSDLGIGEQAQNWLNSCTESNSISFSSDDAHFQEIVKQKVGKQSISNVSNRLAYSYSQSA